MKRWIARCLIALLLGAPSLAPLPAQATVNSSVNKTTVLGNGAQTQFAFSFVGVAAAYISVIFTDASGNQTPLTQGAGATQYQITLNPPLQGAIWGIGGTVTYNPSGSPIANDTTLTIFRTLPLTQAISLQNKNSLTALGNGAETGLDLGMMLDQQNSDQLARAITAPIVDPSTINLTLPTAAQRANTGLAFDSQGNVIAGTTPATGLISSAMQPVVNAASLTAGRAAFGLGGAAILSPNCQLLSNASGTGNLDVGSVLIQVAVNQAVTASFCGQTYIATGPISFTLPRANTLWNGFGLWIHVLGNGGSVTLAIDSHDTIEGLTSGVSGTLLLNSWAFITTDAAASGNWRVSLTSNYPGPVQGTVDNLLPNVQWQLWSGQFFITKQNAAGTGSQTAASCSAFTTVSLTPQFTCANTQQIRTNDLVITSTVAFWGFAGGSFITCVQVICTQGAVTASRVILVTPNTNIGIQGNLGGTSPASPSAQTLTPVSPGDLGTSTNGADGWIKTSTLIATVDDWGAAATPNSTAYPGAIRPLLLRKGITGQEIYEWVPSAKTLARYVGQTITCGTVVYQRVQGGASTWNLHIDDSSGSAVSPNGTGVSFGGYEFRTVTKTIPQNATAIAFYINTTGNSGDLFDVALPTCAFVPSLVQSQLKQNSGEVMRATSHWNPPLLTPGIINFPMSVICGGCGLWGYNNIDLEAISFGTVHNSVGNVFGKLEWRTSTPYLGCNVFFGANVNTTNGLTFGLQAVGQVNSLVFPTPITRIPLYHDGTVAFYTDCSTGVVPLSATFDFTDVDATPPTSVNWLLKRDIDPASNDNSPMWLEKAA